MSIALMHSRVRSLWMFLAERKRLLDLFILANIAFLAPDIYLAHSVNHFEHWAEWIPFYFSLTAPLLLILGFVFFQWPQLRSWGQGVHLFVGAVAIIVGIAGLLFHLNSQFFVRLTIKSLVYTAPFAAPLAYAGLGFLILLNRMIDHHQRRWSQWVILLGLGGFVGNFGLTLADHAQNGFFVPTEWIPVIASALAIGFLSMTLGQSISPALWYAALIVMGLQILVGLLGFYYHLQANLVGFSEVWWDNFIYGTPIFAPLLFPNLALLAILGLVDLRPQNVES